jgi:radical SAM family uncharacterized protein/radical SAM-linked protein
MDDASGEKWSAAEVAAAQWEALLHRVEKPARYAGGEWNQIVKPASELALRAVLAFPDVYEIGMSYLGFQILYETLNQLPGVGAERVYSPWLDMEKLLRQERLPLCSLETRTPLYRFDLVGITLQHEMAYTNCLNLLALGGIPLLTSERTETDPLVFGGGPCAMNPEPLTPMFDAIWLGDAETGLALVAQTLLGCKSRPRSEKLRALARIPGVYIPGAYEIQYGDHGQVERFHPAKDFPAEVHRQWNQVPSRPRRPLVPHIQAVHDRVSVELFRGCTRGCRFCQAGMIHRPVRERDAGDVIEQMLANLASTGQEEASFLALSAGDYSQIRPLIRELMGVLAGDRVALSYPSLRLDSFQDDLAEALLTVRKTGLTFAPEAATEQMRKVINKNLNEEVFVENLGRVFEHGWESIKLYFMIGLPGETEADVLAIAELCRKILRAGQQRSQRRRPLKINLSINVMVPKPHTPFQWEAQLDPASAMARLEQLSRALPKGAHYRLGGSERRDVLRGWIEGALARGDRRLWPVILRAWRNGARFDSWGDHFDWELWQKAFADEGVDARAYTLARPPGERLAWEHLQSGVNRAFFLSEREKSRVPEYTPDCRLESSCHECGMGQNGPCPQPSAAPRTMATWPNLPQPQPAVDKTLRFRYRLQFSKQGALKFIGHLDFVTLIRRCARRARLPLAYSQGFHPQPLLAFGPPLPLGVTSRTEWLDVELERPLDSSEIVSAWNAQAPEGLRFLHARGLTPTALGLHAVISAHAYRLQASPALGSLWEQVAEKAQTLQNQTEVWRTQLGKSGEKKVNLVGAVIPMAHERLQPGGWMLEFIHSLGAQPAVKVLTAAKYFLAEEIPWGDMALERTEAGIWRPDTGWRTP